MHESDDRKERVLHTRVSENLESELKARAQDLGVSVSNLVRNALHNAFDMVEDIVADTRAATAADNSGMGSGVTMGSVTPASGGPDATRILGWQELLLNINAICEVCNAILPRGSRAAAAVYDHPGPALFRCADCLPKPEADSEPSAAD